MIFLNIAPLPICVILCWMCAYLYEATILLGFKKPLRTFILFVFETKGLYLVVLSGHIISCAWIKPAKRQVMVRADYCFIIPYIPSIIKTKLATTWTFEAAGRLWNSGTVRDGRSDICNFCCSRFHHKRRERIEKKIPNCHAKYTFVRIIIIHETL